MTLTTTTLEAQTAPVALKQCPDCGAWCPNDREVCRSCGHEFQGC
jgi:ribosomal protein L40E